MRVSNDYMAEIDEVLGEPLSSVCDREKSAFDKLLAYCGNRLVLFGAGTLGHKTLRCLRSIGVEPLAFADNSQSKWGSQVDGVPVLSPKDAASQYGTSALFVVTVWCEGHFYPETRRMLEHLGCAHVVPAASLRWKFAEHLLPDYCQDLPHKLYEQKSSVRKAAFLWADDASRQEYLNHVRWRALGDQGSLQPPVSEESYFLDSLYRLTTGEVFVDCGAYTGTTAQQVIRKVAEFSRIIAVEADPGNFRRLLAWISTLQPGIASRIEALNVALGATREQLRFRASGNEIACVADDGDVVVDCVPLHDLLEGAAPSFIKMDIEGAEFEALEGARRSIQANRPILAICVYHKQDDLWRIPLLIHAMVQDYRFFLRPHEVDGWQLVCYAVPPGRLRSMA